MIFEWDWEWTIIRDFCGHISLKQHQNYKFKLGWARTKSAQSRLSSSVVFCGAVVWSTEFGQILKTNRQNSHSIGVFTRFCAYTAVWNSSNYFGAMNLVDTLCNLIIIIWITICALFPVYIMYNTSSSKSKMIDRKLFNF